MWVVCFSSKKCYRSGLLRANVTAGIFQIPFQLSRASTGVKSILRKYLDRRIDLADASLIRMAEEFGTGDILTLDKDFAIYRWGKNKLFRISPRP